ncbi:MAG: hypothetical protein AB7O73_08135 [Bacteroidia bacterium]
MQFNRNLITGLAICTAIIFSSCHKKETVEVDNETQSVIDNAVAEQEFFATVPAMHGVAIKTKGTGADKNRPLGTEAADCDSLKLISGDTLFGQMNHVPPTYEFDYTNATCTPLPDAKIREGKIQMTLYGRVKEVGSRIKFVMIGYKAANSDPNKKIDYICDSIVVKTVANDPVTKIREFNIKIYNGKCVGAGGSWTTLYTADRNVRLNMDNNMVQIWGSSNGTNRQGRTFTVDVPAASPLTKWPSCQFISSGILKLTPQGFKTRTVDYSSGTGQDNCDDDATFEVNGNTVAFKLK